MGNINDTVIWNNLTLNTIIVGLDKKRILESNELKWNKGYGMEDGYLTLEEISEQIREIEISRIRKTIEDERFLQDYHPFITIIVESGLYGTIYQYGNYGPTWVEHGTTKGYA